MSLDAAVEVLEAAERGEERHLRGARLRDVRALARDGRVADAVELDVPAHELDLDLDAGLLRERLKRRPCRPTGLGPLGMIHSVTVPPGLASRRWSSVAPSSFPPQAATTRAATTKTRSPQTIASLRRMLLLLLLLHENGFELRRMCENECGHPLVSRPRAAVGAADDELDGQHQRRAGTSGSPSIWRDQRPAGRDPEREPLLAQRGQRRVQVLGELDVVEPDHRRGRAGTSRPASLAARIAPSAIMSEAATTPRSAARRARAACAIAARPLST